MDLAYLVGQRPQDTLRYDDRDIRDDFLLTLCGPWVARMRTTPSKVVRSFTP